MPDLEPITRKEMIIAGEDLEPITREEWFLKHYGGGGSGGSASILYGQTAPATSLGNNGNLYLEYKSASQSKGLATDVDIPLATNDYVTDILAEDYETLTFNFYQYERSTSNEHAKVDIVIDTSDIIGDGHVNVINDEHENVAVIVTSNGYVKLINNGNGQYGVKFSITGSYNGIVIADAYLKVNGEWVKDNFGNETEVSATLVTGQTSVTLQSDEININSTFDIYTSIWGAEPTNVTVANGSITLTFEEQETDMNVKVKVS